jgi:hypothetical protein
MSLELQLLDEESLSSLELSSLAQMLPASPKAEATD